MTVLLQNHQKYSSFTIDIQNYYLLVTIFVVVVVATGPLARDESTTENREVPEAGKLPRAWTRGSRETKSRQKPSGAKS